MLICAPLEAVHCTGGNPLIQLDLSRPALVGGDVAVPVVTGGTTRYVNFDYAASEGTQGQRNDLRPANFPADLPESSGRQLTAGQRAALALEKEHENRRAGIPGRRPRRLLVGPGVVCNKPKP